MDTVQLYVPAKLLTESSFQAEIPTPFKPQIKLPDGCVGLLLVYSDPEKAKRDFPDNDLSLFGTIELPDEPTD
tara:strand:- start:849 stop:1067 length:219 start_codon:yes stop_codon:yes gene_type:complete